MANPGDISTNLATRLRLITGTPRLQVYERWPNQINTPCLIIGRGLAEPEQTFGRGELTKWEFQVYAFFSLSPGYEQAQDNINRLIATSSTGGVFGAIAADRTLGGTVDTTFVRDFTEDDQWEIGDGVAYQGYVTDVEIWST